MAGRRTDRTTDFARALRRGAPALGLAALLLGAPVAGTRAQGDAGTAIPACPPDATFCSGFEEGMLPVGARFETNPPAQLQFDDTMARSGARSVVFPRGAPGFGVRLLVVPIPGQRYWVRLFMRTDSVFGDNSHDSVFIQSSTDGDNNSESGVEFSEQGDQVLLNSDDQLFAQGGPGFPSRPGPTLPADTWLCMEAFFDGDAGDVMVFADGVPLIDAKGFRRIQNATFRFGYLQFNDPRTVWFDDVAVAPERIGCGTGAAEPAAPGPR
jgi:hypothetical protein